MHVVVLGGTGYVGQGLLPSLLHEGHRVRVIARRPLGLLGTSVIRADARTVDWQEVLVDTDAVINLIGIIREHRETGATFSGIHVDLLERLLGAMGTCGVHRLIHLSALGSRPGAVSIYHQTKWAAEQLIHQAPGLSFTILRPSLLFGGGSPFFETLAKIAGTPLGALIPGRGESLFDPVFRGDVARMVVAALADPDGTRGQTFEIGGPQRLSLNALIDHVADVKGLGPVAKRHLPLPWLVRLARLGQDFGRFPVTVDQLVMLGENNVTDDDRWHHWVSPSPLGTDL